MISSRDISGFPTGQTDCHQSLNCGPVTPLYLPQAPRMNSLSNLQNWKARPQEHSWLWIYSTVALSCPTVDGGVSPPPCQPWRLSLGSISTEEAVLCPGRVLGSMWASVYCTSVTCLPLRVDNQEFLDTVLLAAVSDVLRNEENVPSPHRVTG